MSEQAMLLDAARRLRARGARVVLEVPFMGRCIDMAIVRGRWIQTIEFKRHDWRRAFAQAKDHQMGADHAYICVLPRVPSSALLHASEDSGIGVMFYEPSGPDPFEQVVRARRSDFVWHVARRWLLQAIREREVERTL